MTDRGLIIAALLIGAGLGLHALTGRYVPNDRVVIDTWTGEFCFIGVMPTKQAYCRWMK